MKALLMSENPVEQLRALDASGDLANFEPALADLKMSIPKGYHHKDNWKHSLQVLQNAIDRETDGPDLILRTAALLHDIGKPATRAFHANSVVTFTDHDTVGAQIAWELLAQHGYSRAERKAIASLIRMHMRSHNFEKGWSESGVRRLIVDAGSVDQLEKLIIIFYADTTTQFADKRNRIHGNVKALSDELVRVRKKDARAALRPALNGNEVAELLGITPGPELGKVMKFLNSDDGVKLPREDAIAIVVEKFGK